MRIVGVVRVHGGERVLNCGVLGVELAREVGVGDGGVVGREVVALVAEGADPDLGGEVDAGVGVEDGGAGLAAERRVGERGDVRVGAERGDAGGERDHALAGLHLRARPHVPAHADAVHAFGIHARHLRRHGFRGRGFRYRSRSNAVGRIDLYVNPISAAVTTISVSPGVGGRFFFLFFC